jgi:hypothetical protein
MAERNIIQQKDLEAVKNKNLIKILKYRGNFLENCAWRIGMNYPWRLKNEPDKMRLSYIENTLQSLEQHIAEIRKEINK